MVILARESRGINQTELARRLDISQPTISRIEDGVSLCPPEMQEAIADALSYPISFFSQDWDIEGNPAQLFRRRKTISKSIVNKALSRMSIIRNQISQLIDLVEHQPVSLPQFDTEDFEGGAEEVARRTRVALKIPDGPIIKPIKHIEKAGCIVVLFDFETNKIDAFSTWAGDIPLIFLNSCACPSRQRFNLAHELGHLVMRHLPGYDNAEEEANLFASEFLAPFSDIKHMLLPLKLDRLGQLKIHWKISMRAIVYKAHKKGIISGYKNENLMKQINFRGVSEPHEEHLNLDDPRLVKELVGILKDKRGFSTEDLVRKTHVYEDEFTLNFVHNSRFRLVV